jgi:D-glycero-alpha-D-manno-heptose 1-phosphate guanylyltransferase
MPIREAIILAGGLGMRLRDVVPDLPKCMAPVAGKPFLHYVIKYFEKQGIESLIFALGYKHEMIEDYLKNELHSLHYRLSIENEALGTGGAIKLACQKASQDTVAVINGDTFFKIDLQMLATFHSENNADCTLCVKPMQDFERYGIVELNDNSSIKSFHEKKYYKTGLINGGVYAIQTPLFHTEDLPGRFSFETNYLEKNDGKRKLFALVQDRYFIDMGIPEDYARAQREFRNIE